MSHQIFNARTEHLDLLYIKKGYGVYNKNISCDRKYLVAQVQIQRKSKACLISVSPVDFFYNIYAF